MNETKWSTPCILTHKLPPLHTELHYRSYFDVWKLRDTDLPSEAKPSQTSVTRLVVQEAGNPRFVMQEILLRTLNMLSTYYIKKRAWRSPNCSAYSIYIQPEADHSHYQNYKKSLIRILENHLNRVESSHYSLMTPQGREPWKETEPKQLFLLCCNNNKLYADISI